MEGNPPEYWGVPVCTPMESTFTQNHLNNVSLHYVTTSIPPKQ